MLLYSGAQAQSTLPSRFAITAGPTNIDETDANAATTAYTITRTNRELSFSVTLEWTVKHSATSGTTATDFSATTGTVTFNAGDDSKTFTLTIVGDNTNEGDERFSLGLGVITAGPAFAYLIGDDYQVTITDDDDDITFTLNAPPGPVAEGSAPAFTVTYIAGDNNSELESAVTITVTVTNDAPDGHDFTATGEERAFDTDWDNSETLTYSQRFLAGMVTARFTQTLPANTAHGTAITLNMPTVTNDRFNERREHYRVALSGGPSGARFTPQYVQHTIAASDPIAVTMPTTSHTFDEGGILDAIPLRVDFAIPSGVTYEHRDNIKISYTVNGGAVTDSPDITWASVIANGHSSVITITPGPDDNIPEPHVVHNFVITGINAFNFNADLSGNTAITITELDDDPQVWVMTAADPGGVLAADVNENAPAIASPTSPGAANSDARPTLSYFRLVGADASIPVRADTIVTYCLGGTARGGSATDATRDYTWPTANYNPTAIDSTSTCIGRGTIALATGAPHVYRLPIVLNNDGLNEGDETIIATTISASVADGYEVAVRNAHFNAATMTDFATRTIKDSDAISVRIAVTSSDVDGDTTGIQVGEGRNAVFTVTLSKASVSAVAVPYTISGDVVAADYTAATTSPLRIAAGQTTGTITFALTEDADTASEDLTVTLDASGYTAAGSIARTGTAVDQSGTVKVVTSTDARKLTLTRYTTSARTTADATTTVTETNSALVLHYRIGIDSGDTAFSNATAVTWTITHGTTAATDFTATAGSVMMTNSGDFAVTITGDNLNEANEQFSIGLSVADDTADGGTGTDATSTIIIADDDALQMSITRRSTESGVVNEGSIANFTVTADGASAGVICVPFTTSVTGQQMPDNTDSNADIALLAPNVVTCANRNTAVIPDHLTGAATASVEIPAGESDADFSILVRFDNIDEGTTDETLNVALGTPVTRSGAGSATSSSTAVTVPINNINNSGRELSVSATTASVDEGENLVFTVRLIGSIPVTESFDVAWRITIGGNEVDGADSGTVTFTAGSLPLSRTITLRATDDTIEEAVKAVTVTLTDPCPTNILCSIGGHPDAFVSTGVPALRLATAVASAIIKANDTPVTLSIAAPGNNLTEGTAAEFEVSFSESATTTAPLTATWTVAFPTASATVNPAAAADFAIRTGTVSIPAGQSSANISITAINDMVNEAVERFIVTLSNPAGGGPIVQPVLHMTERTATADIAASDQLRVHFTRSSTESGAVNEGSRATFTVTLRTGTSAASAVGTSGGIICVPLRTLFGSRQMPNNNAASGADIALVAPDTGTCANRNTVITPDFNNLVTTSVEIPKGESSANFSILARFDSIDEGTTPERLTVIPFSPIVRSGAGAVVLSSFFGIGVNINNVNSPRALSMSATTANADEGGNLVFTVTVTGAAVTEAFDVDWTITAGGSEVDGSDSGTVHFTTGSLPQSRTITLTATEDTTEEAAETVTVTLTDPCGADVCTVGGRPSGLPTGVPVLNLITTTASATINQNDHPATLSIAAPDNDLPEGTAMAFEVSFSESVTTTAPVTVDWEITFPVASAIAPPADAADFAIRTDTLIIPAGQSSANISITAINDTVNEALERFIVTLSNPAGGGPTVQPVLHLTEFTDTASIADNDPITVTVTGGGGVAEGSSITFTVTLSGGTHGSEVTVPWTLGATVDSGDDDAEAADYSTAAQTPLRFAVGDSMESVTVNITDDGVAEVAEKFAFTVGSVSTVGAHTVVGSPQVATIAASVNTVRTVAITGPATVSEGDATTNYSVTVTGHRPTADISVTWSVTAGGTVAADFDGGLPAGAVLTFTPDNYLTAQTFTITTAEDTLLESGETFTVAIAVATSSTGTTNGDGDTHDTAITDDDTATVTVARTDTDGFTEGGATTVGTAVFTVTVADATLTTAADIAFTVTGADGASDYTVAPTSPLSLTGTTGTITVTAVDDNINEASETVTVTITAAATTGTINIGSTAEAAADITDDDSIAVTVATTATTVDEGDNVTFTVTLSKASDAVVVVPYTVSGVSVGDVALTSLTGTVTVAAGQTEGALTFDITRDASMESAETLTLALDASGYMPAGRGIARGTPASAMLTINASAATVRRLTISGPATISETDANVESGTYTVAIAEGDAFTAETAVTWTVSGVDDADFVAASDRSGSVTFAAGSKTSQTFTVTVAGDNLNEGDESFSVAIGVTDATTDGGTAFGNAHTTVITDDDAITATLGGGGDVEEGDDAEVTVTLSGEMLTAAVVLEYSVTGAITASGVFTIATTDSAPHSFLLSTAENTLNEADKMFTVNATASSAGTVTVAAAQTFTITDDDDITYRIAGGGDVNEVDGAVASFTVHLSGASAAEVTVPIEISGTAESSDYTAPATVAVAAGSVMQNFTIAIVNDTVNEAAETVVVTVGAMPTVATGGGSVTRTVTAAEQSATATIGASDPITYAIGADMEVAEGAATVNIAVTLSGAAGGSEGGTVSVPFTVDTASTAADPADYTVTASPLAFTGGNGAMNITVTVKADTLSEQNETVILNLGTPTGGAGVGGFIAGADISATVTITDDDAITVTIARKSGESGAINEGDSATFTVTLSKTPTADVTVPFILSGEATATSPLTITEPATSGDITVTSTEDTRLESGETVMITLGTVSGGGGIISGSGEVTVGITDNDAATVTIARTDSDGFTEGGSGVAGTAVFTVTVADATLTTAADIAFTVTGAGGASDYVFSPLSPLRITGTDGTITVTAVDDSLNEASETVTVTLTAATTTGTINIGSTATATADITDNDPLSVTIRAGQSSVLEGGMVVFTVAIVGESTAVVVVPYTIGGDVAAGDYTDAGGGSLTIAAGQSGGSFSIQTVDDEMMEDAEDLTVTLGTSPSSAGTVNVGAENSATLLIAANASTVRDFSISVDSATVREGDTVTFTVSLAGRPLASGTSATVMVMVDAGDNADAADYMPTTITRMLSLSSLGSSEFAVTIVDDDLNEGEEELIVTLANPAGGGGGGTGLDVASVTVTIAASNPITYAIGDDAAVSEGASQMQMFSVTLSGAADGSEAGMIMVPFTVGGSASAGTDYNLVTTSPLMFASGNAAMDIVVNVMSDEIFESHESVVINLAIPTTAGTDVGRFIPGSTSATLTILNDDALRVSIARTDSDGFTEGGSGAAGTAVFTVTVANGTSTAPVTVTFAIGGVGITAGDYTVTPASPLTIAAGVATGTVTVTATDDSLGEAAEVLTVTVTEVTGGGGSDPPTVMTAMASATIAANTATATVTRVGSGMVDEGDEVQFQITLSEPNAAAVMVAWSAAVETQTNTDADGLRRANNAQVPEFVDGDANGLSVSGTVNIPPMTASVMFSLTPNQDASEEDAEEVMVRLGTVTVGTGGGAVTASATPATVTVRANEAVIRDEALLAEQMKSVSALLGRAAAVLTATVVRERLLRRPTSRTLNVAGRPVAVVNEQLLASATGPWAADPFLRASVAATDATGAAVTASDLVHGTAFALPLFGRDWASGDASLWGAGGGISGSGKIGQLSYDDKATAFHIGADREWGDGFVAGLSIARTVGEVDAKQTVSNIEIKNRTESQMVSVHPYVLRRLGQHSHGWLVLGIGKSSVDVQETQFNVVRRASSDLTMTMAAFGAAWRRPGDDICVFDLTVHADGVLTRNQLQSATFDDGSLLPKVTSDTMQVNVETEAGRTWECARGIMRTYATAALRDEFGDAKPDGGTAADVGGRLEWDGANGILLRLRAAKQLVGDGDSTRWSAEVDWNRAHRGFALAPYAQLTTNTWRTGLRMSGERVTVRFGVDVDEDGIDYSHLLRGDVTF